MQTETFVLFLICECKVTTIFCFSKIFYKKDDKIRIFLVWQVAEWAYMGSMQCRLAENCRFRDVTEMRMKNGKMLVMFCILQKKR